MKDSFDLLREDQARSARVAALRPSSSPAPISAAGAAPVQKAAGVPFPFDRVDMLSANPRETLNQPYKNSVWVMRAIKKIAGPISAVPLEATDAASEKPIDDPALQLFLRAPVKGLDSADFNEAAVGWLKLAGECFLIGDDTWLAPFATRRSQLIMPRPDQMRHVVDGGEIIGWEYRNPKFGKQLLLPDQVWHKKLWNPYDPWRGLSEYEAARIAAEGDYYAGEFVRNLMANNGDQGVYIVAKQGIPTDAQKAQIIADLREKRARAQRGEFRAVFLTGDIEVQDPKITAPDANLVANRLENRHEIFLAFGVPPSMADVVASYSIGSASARFELIEETCIPTGGKIAGLLEGPASKMAGREVALAHNWDEHSTMQAVRRERLDSANKLWGAGMPWKSVNDYMNLRMKPFPGWDIPYVPIGVMPLDQNGAPTVAPETAPEFAEPDDSNTGEQDSTTNMGTDDAAIDKMVAALEARKARSMLPVTPVTLAIEAGEDFTIFACGCQACAKDAAPAGTIRARDPKRVALARKHLRSRLPMVKQYRSRITRELMAARVETLKKIDKHRASIDAAAKAIRSGATVTRAAAADLIFDKDSFAKGLFAALRKQAALALDMASAQLYEEIGRDDPYKFPSESVLEFTRRRENKLTNVPDEVHRTVLEQIEEGLTDGDTTDELADRVKQAFNGIGDGRARTIATTEVGAAYGYGRHVSMQKAGVKWKQWLTSGHANVRPAHEEAEGQTVPLEEPFEVGGEQLDHPGDDNGSPENVINCHCVEIAVAGKEDDE